MSLLFIMFNIIIISSIIFLYIYFLYYNKKTVILEDSPYSFITNNEYDTIIQHTSSNLTLVGIYQIINYYNADFICINNVNFTNQLVTYESVSDYDSNPLLTEKWTNNKITINNSMIEFLTNNEYIGINKKKYMLTDKITGYNNYPVSYMYILPLKRYIDNKEFILVNILHNYFGSYTEKESYKSIIKLLLVLKNNYADKDFIIIGSFNLQGYEDIFLDMFEENTINILKYKYTINDENGLASPNGIIISKSLYNGIEYSLDFLNGYSTNNYIIKGKLYYNNNIGLVDKTSDRMDTYFDNVIKNTNPNIAKSEYDPQLKDNLKMSNKYNITKTIKNINKNLTNK